MVQLRDVNVNVVTTKGESVMLTDQRKGEIALEILKYKMEQDGTRISPEIVRREAGNLSKAIGIPSEELMEFWREMTQELMDKCFSKG